MSTPAVLRRARIPVADLVRTGRAGRARLPEPSPDRLRSAVTLLFVLDGAVFGSWAARVPGVADRSAPPTARSASPCSASRSVRSSRCG